MPAVTVQFTVPRETLKDVRQLSEELEMPEGRVLALAVNSSFDQGMRWVRGTYAPERLAELSRGRKTPRKGRR